MDWIYTGYARSLLVEVTKTLTTFMPPAVEPAEDPINIRIITKNQLKTGHNP